MLLPTIVTTKTDVIITKVRESTKFPPTICLLRTSLIYARGLDRYSGSPMTDWLNFLCTPLPALCWPKISLTTTQWVRFCAAPLSIAAQSSQHSAMGTRRWL